MKSWSRHYQDVWQERSGDRRLPTWLRVTSLAYGSHSANGHAPFKAGEIALVLAVVDTETGEIAPMQKANVQRAINKAVEYGWLLPESGSTCLVVPGHAVAGGLGKPDAPCPQTHRSRRVSHSVTHLRAVGKSLSDYPVSHSVTTDNALTCENVGALYESSHPTRTTANPPAERATS